MERLCTKLTGLTNKASHVLPERAAAAASANCASHRELLWFWFCARLQLISPSIFSHPCLLARRRRPRTMRTTAKWHYYRALRAIFFLRRKISNLQKKGLQGLNKRFAWRRSDSSAPRREIIRGEIAAEKNCGEFGKIITSDSPSRWGGVQ